MSSRLERTLRTLAAYEANAGEFADTPDDRAWLLSLIARFRGNLHAAALVADLGCASGRETVELQASGLQVVGLDISPAFLRLAVARHPCRGYVRGDLVQLPFASHSLDGAWASASLLHLAPADAVAALAEICRSLKPGGVLYSSVQIGTASGMVRAGAGHAIRRERFYAFYEPEAWSERLRQAGFELLELDAKELDPAEARRACNGAGRGWISAFARRV